jgi:hypothetical protein
LGGSQFKTSLGKKFIRTNKKLGTVVCACHLSYMGSVNRRILAQPGLGIKVRPYLQNNKSSKGWGMTHVGKSLPSKHKVLSSNPSVSLLGTSIRQCHRLGGLNNRN